MIHDENYQKKSISEIPNDVRNSIIDLVGNTKNDVIYTTYFAKIASEMKKEKEALESLENFLICCGFALEKRGYLKYYKGEVYSNRKYFIEFCLNYSTSRNSVSVEIYSFRDCNFDVYDEPSIFYKDFTASKDNIFKEIENITSMGIFDTMI